MLKFSFETETGMMALALIEQAAVGIDRISPEWLERIGFLRDPRRPYLYVLGLPDDQHGCASHLQLLPPTGKDRGWTAELCNVIAGETIAAAFPKPMRTQCDVLALITAAGGCIFDLGAASSPAAVAEADVEAQLTDDDRRRGRQIERLLRAAGPMSARAIARSLGLTSVNLDPALRAARAGGVHLRQGVYHYIGERVT